MCLKKGHFINDCTSKLKCRFCGGKNNSSIHLTPIPEPSTQEGANFSGEEGKRSKNCAVASNESLKLPLERMTAPIESEGIPKLPLEGQAVPKASGLTGGRKRTSGNRNKTNPELSMTDGELSTEKFAEQDNLLKEKEELHNLMMAENSLATLAVAIGPNGMKVNALLDSGADNASLDSETAAKCGFQPVETQTYSVKVGGGRVNTYTEVGVGFFEGGKSGCHIPVTLCSQNLPPFGRKFATGRLEQKEGRFLRT